MANVWCDANVVVCDTGKVLQLAFRNTSVSLLFNFRVTFLTTTIYFGENLSLRPLLFYVSMVVSLYNSKIAMVECSDEDSLRIFWGCFISLRQVD